MDAECARQGSKSSVSNAPGFCPRLAAGPRGAPEVPPGGPARKLMDEKPTGRSLVVRGLKDVRRQGTETLTEQLADRIAAPAGSVRATVGMKQVGSF
jgi:hypothetical protein